MARPKKTNQSLQGHRQHPIAFGLRQEHLRRHAPLQLRQRAAVRAGADLDSVPAHSGRPGDARPGRGRSGGEVLHARAARTLPLAGLGGAIKDSDKPRHPKTPEGKPFGWKRQELFAAGDGKLFDFINKELLPHLHGLDVDPQTELADTRRASRSSASSAAS